MTSFIAELAPIIVKEGEFNSRVGEKLKRYYDVRAAYGDPDFRDELADRMWKLIGPEITCVAGIDVGGAALADTISERYRLKLTIVRTSPKSHGLKKQIECYTPGHLDKLAIVDDVLTRGSSMLEAIRILEPTGARIAICAAIVHREEVNPGILGVPFSYMFSARDIDEAYDMRKQN